MAMRAANRTTYEILATVEKAGLEIGDEELVEQVAEEDVQGHSAEIYDVLCQYVGGEALQLANMVMAAVVTRKTTGLFAAK